MGVVKLADYRPQLEVVEHRVADTEDGFMRVANEITDSLLMADLTVRQLKVMLAIMRKTYGFNKPMDRLTNTQIAAMTGIHHTHVCAAKRQLIVVFVVRYHPKRNRLSSLQSVKACLCTPQTCYSLLPASGKWRRRQRKISPWLAQAE